MTLCLSSNYLPSLCEILRTMPCMEFKCIFVNLLFLGHSLNHLDLVNPRCTPDLCTLSCKRKELQYVMGSESESRLRPGDLSQRSAWESLDKKAHSQCISVWLPLLLTHSQAGPRQYTRFLLYNMPSIFSVVTSSILYAVVLGKCFRRQGKGGEEKDRKPRKQDLSGNHCWDQFYLCSSELGDETLNIAENQKVQDSATYAAPPPPFGTYSSVVKSTPQRNELRKSKTNLLLE